MPTLHTSYGLPHTDGEGKETDDGDVPELEAEHVRIIKSNGMCGVEEIGKRILRRFLAHFFPSVGKLLGKHRKTA